ncbi:RNA-directed DNA polymerase [Parerythrobacter lacustris]|uniref:RNA-directed DNA polymerase n=1 Tax=Parerythrobacter lacustris TaxID=2969984 RepID=A0ABT1XMK8_9SPHN|nr:RNA-directed DNA polymerase [Parerythrobacter lacustris]MCR2832899.1 RNA-directed DNA polymerase [Parerythrobacter lacustris]
MENVDRLKHLTGKGYFPKELPLAFTTADFGEFADQVYADWLSSGIIKVELVKLRGRKKKGGAYRPVVAAADPDLISMPKRGHERRDLSIAHPVIQLALNNEITSNWRTLQKWLARQALSNDEIEIGQEFPRSIKGINFDLHRVRKSLIRAESDWVLQTDINRFYPSIYTHSIAWAAYGKERVKSCVKTKTYDGSLADRLDILVRSCNRNQTSGIPIGPESSRIIAEIISSRIDSQFLEKHPKAVLERIDRLQDDWLLGFEDRSEAETALATIFEIYRAFNLEINGSKTSIQHIADPVQADWISGLRGFLSHRSGSIGGNRLEEFLGLAIRLQGDEPGAPVMNYALSVLEGFRIKHRDVPMVESFLLRACSVAPWSFERIVSLLITLHSETGRISKPRIERRFKELMARAIARGHDYEVIWILYAFRGLGIAVREPKLAGLLQHTRVRTH